MTEPATPGADAIAAEFAMLTARAGVTVPEERLPGLLAAYADFRGQLALLHAPRTHLIEPSNIFALTPQRGA